MTTAVLEHTAVLDKEARTGMDALVRQVRDLPALPETVLRVLRLADDPKAGVADAAKALVSDQALAARVLKLANSAFYGATRRIATVSEAVVILGMRTTRNLVMAASCESLLEGEVAGYGLPHGALLRHSLACASAAQALARRTRFRGLEEAFVAGLLHDLGKVVMNTYGRKQFADVLVRVQLGSMTYADAELSVFGFGHAEAGACLLERWHLPPSLVAAVRWHHAPSDALFDSPLPCLVHVADAVCQVLDAGRESDGLIPTLHPDALSQLRLTAADCEAVTGEIRVLLAAAGPLL